MAATPDASLRLFLALWPDATATRALARLRDAWSWPAGSSPTRTERLHMTLHFIGAVQAERVEEIGAALACAFEPFTLSFGHAELWQHGTAVVCPRETPERLARLHTRLAEALHGLGLPVEDRPLRPHVTVARRARGAVPPAMDQATETWQVSEGFSLVQSLPGGQGYRVLRRFR
jgi:2'-5' RNA ligase